MQNVTINSYSLYKRQAGNRTIWYVRFWDNQAQTYTSGGSTGQTPKPTKAETSSAKPKAGKPGWTSRASPTWKASGLIDEKRAFGST